MNNVKALISISIISLLLSACGADDSNQAHNGYTLEGTELAVNQCVQSGASKSLCECVVKELQTKITANDMENMEADMSAGKEMGEEFAVASAEAGVTCSQG